MDLQCHLHFRSQRQRQYSRAALQDARTTQVRMRISFHARASHEPCSVSAAIRASERTYAYPR